MTKPPMDDDPCQCRGCNVCMMRLALAGIKPPDLPRKVPAPLAMPKGPEPKKAVQKPLFE